MDGTDGPARPASALRKKSKYSPSNLEYVRRIEATRSDTSEHDQSSPSVASALGSAAAAAAHKASPAINFSPFNRVNLIPAKEEYDEVSTVQGLAAQKHLHKHRCSIMLYKLCAVCCVQYKADFDPDVKQLF